VLPLWLTFATLEGLYMTSALTKVPQGAWFTVSLAVVIAIVFSTWRFGKERQWRSERKGQLPRLTQLIKTTGNAVVLTEQFGGGEVTPMKGSLVTKHQSYTHRSRIRYILRQGGWRRRPGHLQRIPSQV
jgi:KUP system potassium uptake protein